MSYLGSLVSNPHDDVNVPEGGKKEDVFTVKGVYDYFHYSCDGYNDVVSKFNPHIFVLKIVFFTPLFMPRLFPLATYFITNIDGPIHSTNFFFFFDIQ